MGRGWDWTDMLAFTVAGYGVVSMDVRGQSGYSQDGLRSPLGNTVKGHIIRGAVEGRDHLFYKDVYLDIYQLVEIITSLPQVDEKRLSSYGASQGETLALVAAALNLRIQRTVTVYPYLAHRIKGEVKMITGLDDDVCYPITQFAIYNRLTCDKAYRIMPEYAHEAMNVFVNDQVYNWLCGSEISFKYVK